MIFRNDEMFKFIYAAYEDMEKSSYLEKGKYYHTLKKEDNSPTVVHDITFQITFVIKGNGIVFLDGIGKKISKMDIIMVKPGCTHRFIANESGLVLFHIHIPEEGRRFDRRILNGHDYDRYII